MILYTIINKNEQKGTKKKICIRISFFYDTYDNYISSKTKKEQANETAPGLYDPLYYNKQKGISK